MKTIFAAVIVCLLFVLPAHAIQDSNANGMSDAWEKFYNSGNLLSTSDPLLAPTADFDGDGWSNEKESIAGTSPFSSALPAGWVQTLITPHPSTAGLFTISFPSILRKNYKLSASSDLVEWVDYPDLMAGTGSNIEIGVNSIEAVTEAIPPALFWRVKISDKDLDFDTLTDWEEALLGTLADNADTDDDGYPDNLDAQPLQNSFLLNPDGSALAASLDTGLIGRWDFETIVPSSTPNDFAYGLNRFHDSTVNARHAGTFEVGLDALGMPSKAATAPSRGFLGIPASLLNNRAVYTVSLWAKMPADAISADAGHNDQAGIFSNHDYVPYGSSTTYGKQSLNALWISNSGSNEILRAGAYFWSNYKIVSGTAVPLSPIVYTFNGIEITRPKGTFTDNKWHHYLYVCNDAVTSLYIDGVLMGTSNHVPSDITVSGANAAVSVGRLYGKALGTTPFQVTSTGGVLKGSIDRLRVWSRALGLSDSQALFHQDISGDGLWDLTSVNSRLWRDADSNGIPSSSEYSFLNSPFKNYPSGHDTDGDGATDVQEQAALTYAGFADSDGDLLPDGWEIANNLDPLDATGVNGGSGNPDADAYNNLNEYRYNTNPRNSSSGGPQNIPSADQMVIKLGVGDRSGSHSEDYVLNCFEIDPATGIESRYYTLRSGGFGQYTEENYTFRKGKAYTFQLDWQGSNLQTRSETPSVSAEGPDYDYHMVVEPQGAAAGSTLVIDAYDPRSGQIADGIKLLDPEDVSPTDDDDDDVADLPSKLEPLRVAVVTPKIELVHTEIDPATNAVITLGPTELYRDEIVDLKITIPAIGNQDLTVNLSVDPEAMRTIEIPTRGKVQMYDFGQIEEGGGVTPNKSQFVLPASAGGQRTIKAVFNKEGTVKIRLKSADGKVDFISNEYTVTPRIRKYGIPYPGFANHDPNKYDQEFIDGAQFWGTFYNHPIDTVDRIKAISVAESNVGAYVQNQTLRPHDILTIGHPDDDVLETIQGNPQQWDLDLLHPKKPASDPRYRKLNYPLANIGTTREAIKWGVLWLYVKAYAHAPQSQPTLRTTKANPNFSYETRNQAPFDVLDGIEEPERTFVDWHTWPNATAFYNGGGDADNPTKIENALNRGLHYYSGTTKPLWPIRSDRSPRP